MPPATNCDRVQRQSGASSLRLVDQESNTPTARVRRLAIWTAMKALSLLAQRKKTGMDQKKASSDYLEARAGGR